MSKLYKGSNTKEHSPLRSKSFFGFWRPVKKEQVKTTLLHKLYLINTTQFSMKHTMYQRKVDEDMLNAVKSVLADISSVSPSSEQMEQTAYISTYRPHSKMTILMSFVSLP